MGLYLEISSSDGRTAKFRGAPEEVRLHREHEISREVTEDRKLNLQDNRFAKAMRDVLLPAITNEIRVLIAHCSYKSP